MKGRNHEHRDCCTWFFPVSFHSTGAACLLDALRSDHHRGREGRAVMNVVMLSEIFKTNLWKGINYLKPSVYFMYHQVFNIQQFYVLPTPCIYVFCVDRRTKSDYFPIQH